MLFSYVPFGVTVMVLYGSHSADLLFHIIILELQYIIPDSSPKIFILSGREKYLLGAFIYWAPLIYWATLIYSGRIYSGCLCSLRQTLLDFPPLLRYACTTPQTTPFKPPSWVWTCMLMPHHQRSPPTPSTATLLRWCRTVRGSIGESPDWHCCSNITPTWLQLVSHAFCFSLFLGSWLNCQTRSLASNISICTTSSIGT